MSESTALQNFIERWRMRWPDWPMAEFFLPKDERGKRLAWLALLQEFNDIWNAAGDRMPADAKLNWWRHELQGWSEGHAHHPLSKPLATVRAPWSSLADILADLPPAREPVATATEAIEQLERFAATVGRVEAVLFGAQASPGTATALAHAIGSQMLALRIMSTALPQAVVPREFIDAPEEAEDEISRERWARWLTVRWQNRCGTLPRRMYSALTGRRLQAYVAGQRQISHASLGTLWTLWRVARNRSS